MPDQARTIETLRVYRWEDVDGIGPYTRSGRGMGTVWDVDYINVKTYVTGQWPMPREDGIDHVESNAVFGFSSIQQMCQWFGVHDRIYLRAMGFRLTVYEVQTRYVAHGRRQVAFERYAQDAPVAQLPVAGEVRVSTEHAALEVAQEKLEVALDWSAGW